MKDSPSPVDSKAGSKDQSASLAGLVEKQALDFLGLVAGSKSPGSSSRVAQTANSGIVLSPESYSTSDFTDHTEQLRH